MVSEGIRQGTVHFLVKSGNLFNVAITRARAALIAVGDRSACAETEVPYLKRFTAYMHESRESSQQDVPAIPESGEYPPLPDGLVASEWERVLYEALRIRGIRCTPQYPADQYRLDLAILDGERKLDIEVDGEQYHRNWDGELVRRDRIRNRRLIELGWDVMRFWVYEVRDNLDGCCERIEKWVLATRSGKAPLQRETADAQ